MKSSTILKLVLEKYYSYNHMFSGICENLNEIIYNELDFFGNAARTHWEDCIDYVKKYRPVDHGVYWWPTDDVETRIDVLQKAIVDAEAVGD